MPELPEVETIRRGLSEVLPGRQVEAVSVLHPKPFRGSAHELLGSVVVEVSRRAKLLLIRFNNGLTLAVHLKMTGQLLWRKRGEKTVAGGHPSVSYVSSLPNNHTRVIIKFTDGSELFFNDMRLFGYLEILRTEKESENRFLASVGPEPFSESFTAAYLHERLSKTSRCIKQVLLDQSVVAGLGNIYVDESLHSACIHPLRSAKSISRHEVDTLIDCIREVLSRALVHGGSTERDYLNAVGEKGTYLSVARVYHRQGQPCLRCGLPHQVKKCKVGGRGTHYCEHCQKL